MQGRKSKGDVIGEIVDGWVVKRLEEGKSRHNVYLGHDGCLYDYGPHYKLAERFQSEMDRSNIFLLNSTWYSTTTAGHVSHVRYALRKFGLVFEATDCLLANVHSDIVDFIAARKKELDKCQRKTIQQKLNYIEEALMEYHLLCYHLQMAPVICGDPKDYVRGLLEADPKLKSKYMLHQMMR